ECEVCKSLDYRDKRLRTSIHIAIDGKSFIVDSGPDFRQQVLRERIKHLDALLFTHEHKDHTAGMDDVRGFNYKMQKDVQVYANPRVLGQLKQEFSYVFAEDRYPGVPQITINPIDNQPFEIEGIKITPIEVMHYKLPVLGFRINEFTYITDAKTIEDHEKAKIYGSKVLVINALRQKEHISHFSLEQALDLIKEIQPEHAYLVHLSHQMGMHKDIDEKLPDNVSIAFDGLKIEI
ncbi:MAG: MBL fold metallo-hydrolase, partial [Cyclobacteriaceae bacterium]